ncbi:HAD-IIB family hydrolase [Nitratireductor sp. ZSWI3]|uniref:HAD-IIB family hydrolase n=1 Tax=Nitratireductor sp. ZSWI3 TaxID=2966359 RepID=UPI00214FB7E5|nr:HAD-IIB family hydrolase [Nitratireductor sp. ZSWI3]MCR4266528.1 HAD-IIB family hydrolase [Nitratireductor sp. ZSWI3]
MRPFRQLDAGRLGAIDFVLTDIDDTLTTDGRLPSIAYEALERLSDAGIKVIPVTGRPAGWCDLIARLWPVDAVVGENGAFYFACEAGGGMTRVFAQSDEKRRADRQRLDGLAAAILAGVPGARISADQPFREADLAIDFAEDGPRLEDGAIDRIVACFEAAGAVAKVSSIHVNGWFGHYDKLAMTRRLFAERYGLGLDAENGRAIFVGDSPNDAPMFGFFDHSVGVANFADFCDVVATPPKWITSRAGGAGFAEVADAVLGALAFCSQAESPDVRINAENQKGFREG